MIDPIQTLAFSMQANPGVYSLLLGSGVSRAAEIPTGWEITLDLIRQLARINNESCEPNPEAWYQDKYQQEADYSVLLDQLAPTPAERQQLLRTYLEPNEQEREEGLKQPTEAHRAIAQMVADGYVRVIITTNFDRLIETALNEVGVVPTVLSSPDQFKGALPLIHTQCCVLKIHGDYLDTRIRNTPAELAKYPDEFNQLLDRILDEFGPIVCGWSATWDTALCGAIYRATSRRFTTYWAAHGGSVSDEATRVIEHRQAQVIRTDAADAFFQTIRENVESLAEFARPHPLSTEAAVGSLKRYLPEPRFRIKLADLINETVERVVSETTRYTFNSPEPTVETVRTRVRIYDAACSTLMAMGVTGGHWAEEEHLELWSRALRRLSEAPLVDGMHYAIWNALRRYPATLLLYSLGLGAIESERLHFLGKLLSTVVGQWGGTDQSAVQLLSPTGLGVFRSGPQPDTRLLEGLSVGHTPLSPNPPKG